MSLHDPKQTLRERLLNDLVGLSEQDGRDRQAERPGSLEIDYQLELDRPLDRNVARLGAPQDLDDERRNPQAL
jgi:hypothetical protein